MLMIAYAYLSNLIIFGILGFPMPNLKIDHLGPLEIFVSSVLIAPILEEFLFRLIPLRIAVAIYLFSKNKKVIFVIIVAASFIFGFVHFGWLSVFIQGIYGLILSWVFLKCGGLNRNYLKAYFSVVSL